MDESKSTRPKHIPNRFYSKDEKLLFESHTHWASWKLSKPLLSFFSALVSISLYRWPPPLPADIPHVSASLDGAIRYFTEEHRYAAIYTAANIVWWTFLTIRWYSAYCNVYAATDQRIMKYRPWIGKSLSDVSLKDLDDVDLVQNLRQRIMGYGPVEFYSGGKMLMRWEAFPTSHEKDLRKALSGRLHKVKPMS